MKNVIKIFFVMMTITESCKKPYSPQIIAADNGYLVVEGLINSGQDSTFIKLSRTVQLSSKSTLRPELNALVTIESDQNNTYTLQGDSTGLYSAPQLNLAANAKYRLRIKTVSNREYLSDYIATKATPEIDSISYRVQNNGVQFYVNTHDPQNKTIYYRWDFNETWKYVSFHRSFFKLDSNGYPTFRVNYRTSDNIYECYRSDNSHQVLLGSSAKLGQDVISMYPIDFITAQSGKVSYGYSFLLREYALTADAFDYWQNLKKNTEQLGSVFDAQPSSLPSNVHCTTNPNEPVVGYLSVSSVTSKRIFVDHININLFTPAYIEPPDAGACEQKIIKVDPQESFHDRLDKTFRTGDSTLVNAQYVLGNNGPVVVGYFYAPTECVDCRTKTPFGTPAIPAYWPYQ
jgi:hypothetical protein